MSQLTTDLSMERAKKTAKIQFMGGRKLPSFKNYRRSNDAVMTPDKGFVKQLKLLDPEFEVVWDWGSSKWEIWRFPKDFSKEACHITTVQTKNKSYRELGADILLQLQCGDTTRFSLNELVNYFDELDNQERRRKMKAFKTKINDITRETKTYVNTVLMQVPRSLAIERAVSNG